MTAMFAFLHRDAILMVLLLLLGVMIIVGVLLRIETRKATRPPRACPDPACGHANPPEARYCAACGRVLPPRPSRGVP